MINKLFVILGNRSTCKVNNGYLNYSGYQQNPYSSYTASSYNAQNYEQQVCGLNVINNKDLTTYYFDKMHVIEFKAILGYYITT